MDMHSETVGHKEVIDKTISIIIPVRNEEKNIALCLTNILENDYPMENVEIIVIDGESTDNTVGTIEKFLKQRKNIKLYSNPRRTPYAGLNVGLEHARKELLMRVDARSIIPKNYIKMCVCTLIQTQADNVGGIQRQIGRTAKQKAIGLATMHPFGVGNAKFRIGKQSGYVDTVYLGCFKRQLFEKIGQFDDDGPVISEDSSLNRRIINSGGKVYLNVDIIVEYPAKESFKDLCKQYFTYGGARAHIFLKYRAFTAWRQVVPIILFLVMFFFLVLSPFIPQTFILFTAISGVYLLADALIALLVSIVKERKGALFPILFIAFPCIHFSFAFGFIVRLIEGKIPGKHWRK